MNRTPKKTVAFSAIVIGIFFLLSSTLVSANFIVPPGAVYGTIYIKADGSVSPGNAPISRSGNVYRLTDNITNYGIKVECDNIALYGSGFALVAKDWYAPNTGVTLENRSGVTVKNLGIQGFETGILLNASSNNILDSNIVVNSEDGIRLLGGSENNKVLHNSLSVSAYWSHGVYITDSAGNTFRNNKLSSGQRNNYQPSINTFNFYIECNNSTAHANLIQDIDASNTLDGKPMYYWVNEHDKTVPPDAGYVALVDCSGITVENLTLENNGQGLLMAATTNSTIKSNIVMGNNEGIVLLNSEGNTFTNNTVTKNAYGVIFYSPNNTFVSNRFSDNEKEHANFQDGYLNSIDGSNMVNGAPLCYWVNQHDQTVPADAGCVFLVNCTHIIVQNLTIQNQMQGLCLFSTSDSLVIGNNLTSNEYGIYVQGSSNNKIVQNQLTDNSAESIYFAFSSGNVVSENQITQGFVGLNVENCTNNIFSRNNISNNNYTGVDFSGSSNNRLLENRIENNGRAGISLEYTSNDNVIAGNNVVDSGFCNVDLNNAQNNTFYGNNFEIAIIVRNGHYQTHQISDIHADVVVTSNFNVPSYNVWDNGSVGNFWSDYNGIGADGDGVGDTPYIVNTSSQTSIIMGGIVYSSPRTLESMDKDHHPSVTRFSLPSEPQLTILAPGNEDYDSDNVQLTFAVTEPGLQVSYSLDLQGELTATGNITLNDLPSGSHHLLVWTTDESGTPANFQSVHFNSTQKTPAQPSATASSSTSPTVSSSPVSIGSSGGSNPPVGVVIAAVVIIAVIVAVALVLRRRR